jgi:hypothetical protein
LDAEPPTTNNKDDKESTADGDKPVVPFNYQLQIMDTEGVSSPSAFTAVTLETDNIIPNNVAINESNITAAIEPIPVGDGPAPTGFIDPVSKPEQTNQPARAESVTSNQIQIQLPLTTRCQWGLYTNLRNLSTSAADLGRTDGEWGATDQDCCSD